MQPLYQIYSKAEERERTNRHYARSAEFFQRITGGEWSVYSCNLWDTARDQTESQAAKLDLLARIAGLRPGHRILDLGCGWGGSLAYLCKTYGASGVGLTLSAPQKKSAEAYAKKHAVDVDIKVNHWKDFEPGGQFNMIYSDEVLVHIPDLTGLFRKLGGMLAPGGRMVHKELHLTHPDYAKRMTRGSSFINEAFGATGNYRTLAEEILFLGQAGLACRGVHTLENWHYRKTVEHWINNMTSQRAHLVRLEGKRFYDMILKYLRIARMFVVSPAISNDIVVSGHLGDATI